MSSGRTLIRGEREVSIIVRASGILAHRYFDTSHAILASTIQHDLPQLEAAVERLTAAATSDDDS